MAAPARARKVQTGYCYKTYVVTVVRRFDKLIGYIDRVQAYADKHRGDVASMTASLDELAAKMPTALSERDIKTWACCVSALTYLGAIPSDDANGTMSTVRTPTGLLMVLEDLETQPAHVRALVAARVRAGA